MQIYSTVQKFHAGRDPLLYYFHLIPIFKKNKCQDHIYSNTWQYTYTKL